MGIKSLKLVLFFSIFTFITSTTIKDRIEISGEEEFVSFYEGSGDFQLDIPNDYSYNYLHIKVESKNNPIILVGDDIQCKNRKAMGLQPYNPINLFIQKEEIEMTMQEDKTLYVCVKCQDENNCSYTLDFKSEDICELQLGEQISFYSKSINQMSFRFIEKSYSLKRNLNTIKNAANIWVKGQHIKSAHLQKEGIYEVINGNYFNFGYIFMIEDMDYPVYQLNIELEQEDYVTIGSLYIKNDPNINNIYDSINELQLNDLEMMGILNQKINNICFPIKKSTIEEIQIAQVNGMIFTKKAKVYFSLNGEEVKSEEINNGLIFLHVFINKENDSKFCVAYPDSDEKQHEIIF